MAKNFIDLALAKSPDLRVYIYARWPRQGKEDFDTAWLKKYTGGWDNTNESKDYFERLTLELRKAYPRLKILMVPVAHQLCGQEHCPLHRSIVTGVGSECPLVFAKRKDGQRIPVQVTVAPIRNAAGEIVGGVEAFRDVSPVFRDLEKARSIQSIALQHDLPQDARIQFSTHYIPHDIVGGDYYGIRQLDRDHYGFFLADVMGHGLAAALYTMHLSSLWDRYCSLLKSASACCMKLGNELNRIVKGGEAFATGICGLVDANRRQICFAGAGNPPALLIHASGEFEQVECPGLPFGLMEDAPYDDTALPLEPGDRLLFFSDGAMEIHNAESKPPASFTASP